MRVYAETRLKRKSVPYSSRKRNAKESTSALFYRLNKCVPAIQALFCLGGMGWWGLGWGVEVSSDYRVLWESNVYILTTGAALPHIFNTRSHKLGHTLKSSQHTDCQSYRVCSRLPWLVSMQNCWQVHKYGHFFVVSSLLVMI